MNSDLHNKLAGPIVASIVRPVIESGGSPVDALLLLESVVVGVSLAFIRLGGDEIVLNTLLNAAKERLAEIRLKDIETKGSCLMTQDETELCAQARSDVIAEAGASAEERVAKAIWDCDNEVASVTWDEWKAYGHSTPGTNTRVCKSRPLS